MNAGDSGETDATKAMEKVEEHAIESRDTPQWKYLSKPSKETYSLFMTLVPQIVAINICN